MTQNVTATIKGEFKAVVEGNRPVRGSFHRLELEFAGPAAKAFGDVQPGQFVEVNVAGAALPPVDQIPEGLRDAAQRDILLRRPFSFTAVAKDKDMAYADILYCVLGPATLRMTTLRKGDVVSVIGPLGRGYWMPEGKKRALLVAGGMGVAPLQHLAQYLTAHYATIEAIAFAGAKTKESLPCERPFDKISQGLEFAMPEFAKYGVRSIVATDDGSVGFAGMVTDCLAEWLTNNPAPPEQTIIYACGPEPMLAKVAAIAKDKRIDCQVSMERLMACGFGVCQSCAVECRSGDQNIYKLCCKDGPVFDAKEVVF